MLGRDLVSLLAQTHETIGVDIADCDLTDREAAVRLVEESRPDWVVNCAAYTAVDKAESEPESARRINVEAVGHLALACRQSDARLLHISTDYVFDGSLERPYRTDDEPSPLGVYGRTKYEGEQALRHVLGDLATVARTAWLYGPQGSNFVEAIRRQIDAGKPLRVVGDQVGAPTYTAHLAGGLLALLENNARGTFHITNGGHCTWFEFARAICEFTGHPDYPLSPMSSAELNRPAPRPANSRLDLGDFEKVTGTKMPTWQEGLRAYLKRPRK